MAGTRSGAFGRQCPKQCRTRRGADRCRQGAFARLPGPGSVQNGIDTLVGSRGVRLSGGQQARTALARTLSHAKPLIVLDDPFAALDRNTEEEIFRELKAMSKDRIILLISHRLYLFDQTDQVIWMENGQTQTGTHEKMLQIVPEYANLCKVWKEGADHA